VEEKKGKKEGLNERVIWLDFKKIDRQGYSGRGLLERSY
jgi:hypothetical protein